MPYRLTNLSELFTWIAEEELPRRDREGLSFGMCFAAEWAEEQGLCSGDLSAQAQDILMARLHPHVSYRTWLRENHPDIAALPDAAFHGRVAWARALAEEFRQ